MHTYHECAKGLGIDLPILAPNGSFETRIQRLEINAWRDMVDLDDFGDNGRGEGFGR